MKSEMEMTNAFTQVTADGDLDGESPAFAKHNNRGAKKINGCCMNDFEGVLKDQRRLPTQKRKLQEKFRECCRVCVRLLPMIPTIHVSGVDLCLSRTKAVLLARKTANKKR